MDHKALLKSKSLRVTEFRLEVLAVFSRYSNAISLSILEQELSSFDRITLYRTLKSYAENGIVHEILIPGMEKKMALCAHDCDHGHHHHTHQHAHFQCTKCSEVFCVDAVPINKIQIDGFKVDAVEVAVKGTCKDCL